MIIFEISSKLQYIWLIVWSILSDVFSNYEKYLNVFMLCTNRSMCFSSVLFVFILQHLWSMHVWVYFVLFSEMHCSAGMMKHKYQVSIVKHTHAHKHIFTNKHLELKCRIQSMIHQHTYMHSHKPALCNWCIQTVDVHVWVWVYSTRARSEHLTDFEKPIENDYIY